MAKKAKRMTFAESWAFLKRKRLMSLKGSPSVIDHHAGWDREGDPTNIDFFRTAWEDADLANLTIPRLYINRSDLQQVSFRNSDLNQSFMCWNDFVDCDFTDADLTCCDMRRSLFRGCKFIRCKMVAAYLSGSEFDDCDFTDADLRGAIIDTDTDIDLTDEQMNVLECVMESPEPKGG